MREILEGVRRFRRDVYPAMARDFAQLAGGQNPKAVFLTCSDSRIDPNLVTGTRPGDLFIIRNAGNIVPPHGHDGGEAASLEFAIDVLRVPHIIVCGHSQCGAMAALLNRGTLSLDQLPLVVRWLRFAEGAGRIVAELGDDQPAETRLMRLIEHNVMAQLDHLRTLPAVAAALQRGALELHGWVYRFETGQISIYDGAAQRFVAFE
jgi:carbonic anhydrase